MKVHLKFNMMKKLFTLSYFLLFICYPVISQNVTIGTPATVRAKLEVQGVAGIGNTSGIFGTDGTGISLQRNWPTIGFNQYHDGTSRFINAGFGAIQYLNPASGEMAIDMLGSGAANSPTAIASRGLTITNNGNVSVRMGGVTSTLGVAKAGNVDGSAVFGGTNYNSHFHYSVNEDTYIRAGKTGSNVYINDIPSGKIIIGGGYAYVGINTASPNYSLEIRQTGLTGLLLAEPNETFNNWEQVVGFYNGGPASSLKLIYNGVFKGFFQPTDGAYHTASDKRLKTNIHSLPSVLNKIMKLRAVEYEMKYNNNDHKKTIGFIAQEVQQVFPELVSVLPDTPIKGVEIKDFHLLNYNAFRIIAIKGVQEEQDLIKTEQEKQAEIFRRLQVIEKKLSANDQQD